MSFSPPTNALDAALAGIMTTTNARTKTTRPIYTVESARDAVIDDEDLMVLDEQQNIILEGMLKKFFGEDGAYSVDYARAEEFFRATNYMMDIKPKKTHKSGKKKTKTDEEKDAQKAKRAEFDESINRNIKNEFDESSDGWERVEGLYGEILFDDKVLQSCGKKPVEYFYTFPEAIAAAEQFKCESITKTAFGYSLRNSSIPINIGISKSGKGKGILSHPERSIGSWTKTSKFCLPHPTTIPVNSVRMASKYELENIKFMMKNPIVEESITPPATPPAIKEAAAPPSPPAILEESPPAAVKEEVKEPKKKAWKKKKAIKEEVKE